MGLLELRGTLTTVEARADVKMSIVASSAARWAASPPSRKQALQRLSLGEPVTELISASADPDLGHAEAQDDLILRFRVIVFSAAVG